MKREPCTNADGSAKKLYKSRAAADHEAKKLNRDYRNDEPAQAYLCPGTDHFHVGHDGYADA